jgi:hypothetical protein
MVYVRVAVSRHHLLPPQADPTWSLTTSGASPMEVRTTRNGLQGYARTAIDELITALIERNLTEYLPKRCRKEKHG